MTWEVQEKGKNIVGTFNTYIMMGGNIGIVTQGADSFIDIPTDKFLSLGNYFKIDETQTIYGYSCIVFEPNDDVKDDLTRIIFYSIAKYKSSCDWTLREGISIYSGNKDKNFSLIDYAIKLLTKQNGLDPPDDWERSLNEALLPIQGNINPFIYHQNMQMFYGKIPVRQHYIQEKIIQEYLLY